MTNFEFLSEITEYSLFSAAAVEAKAETLKGIMQKYFG